MKMNFQVMLFRMNRYPNHRFKNKNSSGWKHVTVNEYIDCTTARQEEQYFFSLFHQGHRKT